MVSQVCLRLCPFGDALLQAMAIQGLPKRLLEVLSDGGLSIGTASGQPRVEVYVCLWELEGLSWPPDGWVRWPVRSVPVKFAPPRLPTAMLI